MRGITKQSHSEKEMGTVWVGGDCSVDKKCQENILYFEDFKERNSTLRK